MLVCVVCGVWPPMLTLKVTGVRENKEFSFRGADGQK